jgi:hypothetical protein
MADDQRETRCVPDSLGRCSGSLAIRKPPLNATSHQLNMGRHNPGCTGPQRCFHPCQSTSRNHPSIYGTLDRTVVQSLRNPINIYT